jgi:hypothetical protein
MSVERVPCVCMRCGVRSYIASVIGGMRTQMPLDSDPFMRGYHAALDDLEDIAFPEELS